MSSSSPEEASREEVTQAVLAWRLARSARLDADKVADKLKDEELRLKRFVISAMMSQKYEGIVAGERITGVSIKDQPVVTDREALSNYILENRLLGLLQFRLAGATVKEMEEAGVVVPGVGKEQVFDLFDRKS